MTRLGLALLILFFANSSFAQEFIANVNINTPRLQKADPSLFGYVLNEVIKLNHMTNS